MNIDKEARHWLLDHGYDENEPTFTEDVESLKDLLLVAYNTALNGQYLGVVPEYDDMYGDNKECLCGHPYYRHFDPFEDMAPVGCKYCSHWGRENDAFGEAHGDGHCTGFKEKPIIRPTYQPSVLDSEEHCRRVPECSCSFCRDPYYGFKP